MNGATRIRARPRQQGKFRGEHCKSKSKNKNATTEPFRRWRNNDTSTTRIAAPRWRPRDERTCLETPHGIGEKATATRARPTSAPTPHRLACFGRQDAGGRSPIEATVGAQRHRCVVALNRLPPLYHPPFHRPSSLADVLRRDSSGPSHSSRPPARPLADPSVGSSPPAPFPRCPRRPLAPILRTWFRGWIQKSRSTTPPASSAAKRRGETSFRRRATRGGEGGGAEGRWG